MGYGYFPFIQPSGVNPLIYDANGNLILQLGYVAGVSSIKGQIATGTDVNIYANSTDSYPYLRLHGAGEVEVSHAVSSYFKILDGLTQSLKATYAANVTTLEGGVLTGDDLILKANSIDARSKIILSGNGDMTLDSQGAVIFSSASISNGYLMGTASEMRWISYGNRDIWFDPNGTGYVKFGTYTSGAASDSIGYITIKDAGGTTRKLMVQA